MMDTFSIKDVEKSAGRFSEKLRIAFYDVFEDLFGDVSGRVILSHLEIKTRRTSFRMNMKELFADPERALELLRMVFGDTTYEIIEEKILEALSELHETRQNRRQDLKNLINALRMVQEKATSCMIR